MFPLNGLAPRSPATGPLETNEVSAPPSLQSRLQEINLKIIAPTGQIEGPGGEIRIQLENPTIGPEDIPLNEFVQQLESLAEVPMPVFALGQGLHELSEGSQAFAEMVLSSRASGQPENPEEIAAMGNQFAQQAELIEVNIRALIENSTYPNFSDFLKELVKVAHKYAEAAKVAVRHVRRDGLDTVKKLEKNREISEDDQERLANDVQKATDAMITEIDQLLAAKEKEILTV